jgi:DNA-binding response OmpR family regulator
VLSGKAVLVVDDEPGMRRLAARAIDAAGGEAFQAADGRQAIIILERGGIDAAVIDIFMPEKEGLETIVEAKRRWPRLKVIAISGGGLVGHTDALHTARIVGADAVMAKPFSFSDLVAQIARLVGRSA